MPTQHPSIGSTTTQSSDSNSASLQESPIVVRRNNCFECTREGLIAHKQYPDHMAWSMWNLVFGVLLGCLGAYPAYSAYLFSKKIRERNRSQNTQGDALSLCCKTLNIISTSINIILAVFLILLIIIIVLVVLIIMKKI